jgi:hypothetical protein
MLALWIVALFVSLVVALCLLRDARWDFELGLYRRAALEAAGAAWMTLASLTALAFVLFHLSKLTGGS